jgi:hypothetical protein
MNRPQRYTVKLEPVSHVHTYAKRRMHEVRDSLTGEVVRRFWYRGEADQFAQRENDVHQHAVAVGAR